MATARTRSSPRCCCTSATSVRPVGHRDLERVVDRRQMAVEHGVEHDALDLDDPPDGTVLSGHARSFVSSRGAHELYPRRPRVAPIRPSRNAASRTQRGARSGVTKSGRRAGRAERAGGRPACRSCSSRRRSRRAARHPTASAPAWTSSSPRRRCRAPRPPRLRRRGRPPAARARGDASGEARQHRDQSLGHGAGRSRAHVQDDRLRERAPFGAVVAVLEVLVQRRALDLAGLAVRGHGDPQPGDLAERREWVLGSGAVMAVWREARGRCRRQDGCLFPPAWTRPAWKSLRAAAESHRDRLLRGARRGAGTRRGAHLRRVAPRAAPGWRRRLGDLRERVGERHEDRGGIAVGGREPLDPGLRVDGRCPLRDAESTCVPTAASWLAIARATRACAPGSAQSSRRRVPSAPALRRSVRAVDGSAGSAPGASGSSRSERAGVTSPPSESASGGGRTPARARAARSRPRAASATG